ncbi:MAG: hypothetical protein ACI308_08570 [Muribaculaceae bacterium]
MKKSVITLVMALVMGTCTVVAQPYFTRGHRQTQYERQRNNYGSSMNVPYKGFVEIGYAAGIGDNRADRFDILTTHGLQVSDNAFFGVGGGLSVSFNKDQYGDRYDLYDYHTTGVSIPIYVDLKLGNVIPSRTSFVQPFFDLKIGAQFRVSEDVLAVGYGYYDGNNSFYMSPSVGIRIPTGGRGAINLAATYNLTTHRIADWGGSSYYNDDIKGLSSFGVRLSFEW